MNDNMSRLMMMDFERGHGTTAQEIAKYIGKEKVFDDKVIKVSKNRFKEIISAFTKLENKDHKEEIKRIDIDKDKAFINAYEIYSANRIAYELTIQALEYGRFKNNNEADLRKNAEKGKKALMLYLIEIGSDYAGILSDIKVDEENKELITFTEFMETQKQNIRKEFIYGDLKTIHDDRFNRIFSYVKQKTKKRYDDLKKDNNNLMNNDNPLFSVKQMIDYLIRKANEETSEYNLINEYKISNNNNLEDTKQYIYILMQNHKEYHQQSQ